MRAHQYLAPAVALLLAGSLAACSDDAAPASAGDVPAVDRSEVREGGTLRWAVDAVPATLNVFQPGATEDSGLVARAVLPTLFRLDAGARAVPDPDYLASAESTPPGQNPQTVTYRLNPRAAWSDGTPIGAADFTAQWKALAGADPAYVADLPAGYGAIESVAQGSDPREVRVVFKQPYASWKGLFSPLYPAAATATPEAFNRPLTAVPSAGPFTLQAADAAAGRATVVRNPKWWGAAAKAEQIDFLAVPAADRLDALDQGKLDVAALTDAIDRATPPGTARTAPPPDAAAVAQASAQALKRAEALPGLTLHRAAAAGFTQLTLNSARGPLADQTVRRAVVRAVDRGQVADAALSPLGVRAVPLGNHLLMNGQVGYRDNSAAAGSEPAAQLLDQAGWKSGGASVRSKDGKDLVLTLLLPDGSATARRTADTLAAELSGAGITVRPQPVAPDVFVKDHLATGDFDLALFSWPATGYPAADERALYTKPRPGPDGHPVAGLNYAGTGSAELDQLLARAAAELDPAVQRTLLQEADARIWQLAHSVPLYQRPDLVAVRSTVAGAGAYGFSTPRYQDVGFKK
ncbi:ABC transporter family substrate-binding protein [Kitasatospora sp. NPDC048365]|uniref:ABC transporter family substrate-binding protein n=1 Tax=Kitasatospora sp. NPDC048365 TaxID=3364050 RepID=UPI0037234539